MLYWGSRKLLRQIVLLPYTEPICLPTYELKNSAIVTIVNFSNPEQYNVAFRILEFNVRAFRT